MVKGNSGAPSKGAPQSFTQLLKLNSVYSAAALIIFLVACFWAYSPGLQGSFLFDDYVNFSPLGAYGGIHNLQSALHFIFSGNAGPSGRPIALASFLIDATNWPTSPYPFKFDNILFHLIAGLMLAWLTYKLAQTMKLHPNQRAWISVLSAGLWLLHPFFVSTVLFDVQRMAILAALFVAAGLALYVSGRLNLAENHPKAGFVKTSLGVGLFTPLAFFSKENGALLPLLALSIEGTIMTASPVADQLKKKFNLWKVIFIYLPLLVMALHFAIGWHDIQLGYHKRSFTLAQRLLTEPRILMDYLYHLFIPRMQTAGLYHDNYVVSTSLVHPASTLPSIAVLAISLLAALIWRRRFPILALAVLFFLSGQLLESSFIPLELYYEHRNYLPSMMLFFALSYYLVRYAQTAPKLAIPLTVVLLFSFTGLTYARSSLWGNMAELSLVWAKQNPSSRRAQQQAAITWSQHNHPRLALAHIETALHYHPYDAILHVQVLTLHCGFSTPSRKEIYEAKHGLAGGRYNYYLYRNLQHIIKLKNHNRCPQISLDSLLSLNKALLSNPIVQNNRGARQKVTYMQGELLLMANSNQAAENALKRSFVLSPTIETAMQLTGLLATYGDFDAALRMLHNAEYILKHAKKSFNPATRISIASMDYPSEIKRMRKNILESKEKKNQKNK